MFKNLTWLCHSCGRRRPDSRIAVLSFPLPSFLPIRAEQNWRYCIDNPECVRAGEEKMKEELKKISTSP